MTGLELLRNLKSRDIDVPAIVTTTAHIEAAVREQFRSAGAVVILPKPWPTNALIAAIERAQGNNPR